MILRTRLDLLDIRATGRNLATIRSPGGRITAHPIRAVAATAAAPVMVGSMAARTTAVSTAVPVMAVSTEVPAMVGAMAVPATAVSMAALAV